MVAIVVAASCKPQPTEAPADAAAPEPRATFRFTGTPAPPPRAEAGAPDAPDDDGAAWLTSPPVRAKSIGHTSVVFKVELANGKKLAFKPRSKKGASRYKGEIAAYALAKELGVPNVPPAYARSFEASALRAAASRDDAAAKLFAEQVVLEGGRVRGAAIPWIDELEFIPFEKDPWWTKWRGWLKKGAPIPDDQKDLARQASVLVCFDYVTGNWDRWSGANVGFDKEKKQLLFVDNDGAFFDSPPKDGLERNKRLLRETERFSRRFVTALREAKDRDLSTVVESAPARDGVRARMREVLEDVDAKIAANGESETLWFE